MVDPISIGAEAATVAGGSSAGWLPWATAAGTAAAGAGAVAGALKKGPGGVAPPVPAAPASHPTEQTPTPKPQRKGMQQSFLSGVAGAAQSSGGATGKTLLGQ